MNPILCNIYEEKPTTTHNGTVSLVRLIESYDGTVGSVATMNYAWLESGKELEKHAHLDGIEYYFVIDGSGKMLIGEEWFAIKKGDFVKINRGKIHSLQNTTNENLVFLSLRTLYKNYKRAPVNQD